LCVQQLHSELEPLNWEIVVVDKPNVDTLSLPRGKIILYSGVFEHFKTDTEIAIFIAHEVLFFFF